MFDSRVLETAIGLIFLFLGVSLLTTAIQELIASVTKLRARTLQSGLKSMLVRGQQGLSFYQALLRHPAIAPLQQAPSYISAEQFSTSVVHLISGNGALTTSVTSLRIAALNMTDAPLKPVVLSLFRDGENDLADFERRLRSWFDQSMDHVSGVYKRLSQYLSLVIGVVLAFSFQINAIGIGYALWNEPSLRGAMVEGAMRVATKGQATVDALAPQLMQFQLVPIWLAPPTAHLAIWFIGCSITAIAVSLGAPFWFDLLQSFVSLRGTGAPPKSTA